eukprot:3082540-Pyramimonas_sp.AAC.1
MSISGSSCISGDEMPHIATVLPTPLEPAKMLRKGSPRSTQALGARSPPQGGSLQGAPCRAR